MSAWLTRPGLPRNGRIGLAVAALGGLIAALSPFTGDLVRGGSEADPAVTAVVEFSSATQGAVMGLGIATLLLLGAASLSTRLIPHLVGVLLATSAAATYGFTVAQARQSDRLSPSGEIEILMGGQILLLGTLLCAAGIVMVLLAAKDVEPLPPPEDEEAARQRSPAALVALILSLLGMFLPLLPAVGATLGAVASNDAAVRPGRPGRGMALAALVIGVVALALQATLLVNNVLAAEPAG